MGLSHRVAWAKTRKNRDTRADEWMPLINHLIKVGAAAQILVNTMLSRRTRNRLAQRFGCSESELCAWIGFLAAVHDYGKLTSAFQRLSDAQSKRLDRILPSNWQFKAATDVRHGLASTALLAEFFTERFGMDSDAAYVWAQVTGGHHGSFFGRHFVDSARSKLCREAEVWEELRSRLLVDVQSAFNIEVLPPNLRETVPFDEDALLIAGLITIADWIGSDDHYHPPTDVECSDRNILERSKSTVESQLAAMRLPGAGVEAPGVSFESAIGRSPYPHQRDAEQIVSRMQDPGMAIIEIPTGWGKTEIAFWIAAYFSRTFLVEGAFLGLPTMVTANQTRDRYVNTLLRWTPSHHPDGIVSLVHGQAEFSSQPEIEPTSGSIDDLIHRSDQTPRLDEPQGAHQSIRGNRRGILARHGVGTVDQVLKLVLLTRHFPTRAFALAGKTVVFDEVHSYSTYMSRLFDASLTWLARLSCPVIILSATLPSSRVQDMVNAYARGADWRPSTTELATYPRITTVDSSIPGCISETIATPTDQRRTIHLKYLPSADRNGNSDWHKIAREIEGVLETGGTCACICNTVDQAQKAYDAFAQVFPPHQLIEYHSRMRRKDRATVERAVLKALGKPSDHETHLSAIRPRCVVIATQVIEQSLDLDADIMVTEFCPIDLLIQRAGRLQRHAVRDGQRPPALSRNPRLWVTGYHPSLTGLTFSGGTQWVYQPAVLYRTWLALNERPKLVTPDDVQDLIESVYSDDAPVSLPSGWNRAYACAADRLRKSQEEMTRKAATVMIPEPVPPAISPMFDPKGEWAEDDNPSTASSAVASTRDGRPSYTLVVLTQKDQQEWSATNTSPPDLHRTQWLLDRSLPISLIAVTDKLRNLDPPAGWRRSSWLKFARLIELDDQNSADLGSVRITLSDTHGLVVQQRSAKGEGQ